jgi:hypothetical protein
LTIVPGESFFQTLFAQYWALIAGAGAFLICISMIRDAASLRSTSHMKCSRHQTEAIAVCAYCGRALCADCVPALSAPRMVCSADCAATLARNDKALQLILQKSFQSARASAFYSFLCGGLSAAGAIGAYYYLPSPFLIWFTAGCSVVFLASGVWYGIIARKQNLDA